jgi:hypothetical protein
MSRNKCFFSRFEYRMFYILYPFVIYLLTLPRTLMLKERIQACCARTEHGPFIQNSWHILRLPSLQSCSQRQTPSQYTHLLVKVGRDLRQLAHASTHRYVSEKRMWINYHRQTITSFAWVFNKHKGLKFSRHSGKALDFKLRSEHTRYTEMLHGETWQMCCPMTVNRRFGGTYRLHIQGRKISHARNSRETLNELHGIIWRKMKLSAVSFRILQFMRPVQSS